MQIYKNTIAKTKIRELQRKAYKALQREKMKQKYNSNVN
jgi:hypothetical protein